MIDDIYIDDIEAPAPLPQSEELSKYISAVNIADMLSAERLAEISGNCIDGYKIDVESRAEWLEQAKSAMKLAKQERETKTSPWRGAANIKLPTITDATIKFAARAYPELLPSSGVVACRPVGNDPDGSKRSRADRVSSFMSWQLDKKEREFCGDIDTLLHMLPIVGHMFRKRYWCGTLSRTKSETCMPEDIVVNQGVRSLDEAPRITHIIRSIRKNDIVSNQRRGVWRDVDLAQDSEDDGTGFYTLLEQVCYLDLDDDGYSEPYIVTLDESSGEILRIAANYADDDITINDNAEIVHINPITIYVDYRFLPSLDGSYYGMGFGQMLEPLTRSANTLINQITDAGSLSNMQGGFLSREVKLRSGRMRFDLGEWKRTEATSEQLSRGVFPLPTKEPSPTLFNLLGLMLEMTNDLSSVQDIMAGDAPSGNMPATTTMALIEQGMKTLNSIYKRIHTSLTREFEQLYRLNRIYLDEQEYFAVMDDEMAIAREDFDYDDMDIMPVAEPQIASDMQRIAKAEALRGLIGSPGIDPRPIMEEWFSALKIDPARAAQIMPEQQAPQGPDPQMLQMMQELELKQADVTNRERELEIKERELEIKAFDAITKSIERIAAAEAKEAGTQISAYREIASSMLSEMKAQKVDNANLNVINSKKQFETQEGL